jgi:hypothetical protein
MGKSIYKDQQKTDSFGQLFLLVKVKNVILGSRSLIIKIYFVINKLSIHIIKLCSKEYFIKQPGDKYFMAVPPVISTKRLKRQYKKTTPGLQLIFNNPPLPKEII